MTLSKSRQPGQRRTQRRAAGRLQRVALIGPAFGYYSFFVWAPAILLLTFVFTTEGRFGGVTWEFSLDAFRQLADPLYV